MSTDEHTHYALIPVPGSVVYADRSHTFVGPFVLRVESADPGTQTLRSLIRVELARCGLEMRDEPAVSESPRLTFALKPGLSKLEGWYRLDIEESGVHVQAGTMAGLFYGLQTVIQMLSGRVLSPGVAVLRGVSVIDSPLFEWRGMHLDVSRHFMPVSFVEKYIDLLARHKMNRFHWHLTDDQGWRIEIKKYPRLTQVGAWRKGADGEPYGGFYTQEEVRQIVAYAQARQVMIIPEIEMPGHASAALAAYPEYSCNGGPFALETKWGVFDDVYCAGNDRTFTFLGDILAEVADLFPGPYIHIGGDECPKIRWRNHSLCQARMKAEGLADEDALQSYFIGRIAEDLRSLGKKLIGWDEILDGGAPEGSIVMAWRHSDKGVAAANAGHDVIMTPMPFCYFDHYQGVANEPKAIGGFTPLRTVYGFTPVPRGIPGDLAHRILGAQGNVWTEYMPDADHVEYMVFPRLCALAERLWSTNPSSSFPEFLERLRVHLKCLDQLHVHYRPLGD